jgi:hypothetical protein
MGKDAHAVLEPVKQLGQISKPGAQDKDLRPAYDEFCARQALSLEDYPLFRALKEKYRASRCG